MLKLLKNMRRKEWLMALLCLLLVVGQVYFDLRLPDYMTELTTLIKTSGTTGDIVVVGLKMLGCTAVSAVLAIGCGFLSAVRFGTAVFRRPSLSNTKIQPIFSSLKP